MDNAIPTVSDYSGLSPDLVIDAVESVGLLSDSRILALNSHENRVYQVGIDEQQPIIAKFYRPLRWTDEQIQEEHDFCFELVDAELPVVPPLKFDGKTLLEFQGYRFSIYPRQGGRAPELDNLESIHQMGRFMGRIHLVGAATPFQFRPTLSVESFGDESVQLINQSFIPKSLKPAYESLTRDLLSQIRRAFDQVGDIRWIRTHGDCHIGNVLWRNDAPNFVDFDDARMAPAIQDLWMLLSGERHERESQLAEVIDGYNDFHDFDPRELHLIEPLRTLRIMHHAAWLARRWEDPAFPKAFPWFNSERYWGEHILELREQMSALQEPTLRLR